MTSQGTANPTGAGQQRKLKVGLAGMGAAASGAAPIMANTPYVELVAGADIREQARDTFQQTYHGRAYATVEELCEDPEVEVVWVASPNHFHCEHVCTAAEHGKHVSVEKPMATSVSEAEQMIAAAERNNVKLVAGRTGSTSPGIQAMRRVIQSGELGKVCAINVWSFSDWMLRPRLPEEVNPALGGGVVFRQTPHQIDSVRLLGGGMVRSVRATTGQWMPERGAPGYCAMYLEFEDGTPATVVYNGYGYFGTAELVPWAHEARLSDGRLAVRKALRRHEYDDNAAKEAQRARGGQGPSASSQPQQPSGFRGDVGLMVVSCERGDIRQSPGGLWIYDDEGQREVPVSLDAGRGLVELEEIYQAVTHDQPIRQDGYWGMATLEVVMGILQSAEERREVMMTHQRPTYE